MSPAYDLMDTRIHVEEESFFALTDLFKEWHWSNCRIKNPHHHPCLEDFVEFGRAIGISDSRVNKLLEPFHRKQEKVRNLVNKSFLDDETKKQYISHYTERLMMLNSA